MKKKPNAAREALAQIYLGYAAWLGGGLAQGREDDWGLDTEAGEALTSLVDELRSLLSLDPETEPEVFAHGFATWMKNYKKDFEEDSIMFKETVQDEVGIKFNPKKHCPAHLLRIIFMHRVCDKDLTKKASVMALAAAERVSDLPRANKFLLCFDNCQCSGWCALRNKEK